MQPLEARHPDARRLAAFGLGQLDDAESVEIEGHLAGCPNCLGELDRLPADPFVSLLQVACAEWKPTRKAEDCRPAPPPLFQRLAAVLAEAGEKVAPHEKEPQPTPEDPPVPAELVAHPRYEVLKRIGVGGMGTVYQARHRVMERLVALKIVNPRLVDRPRTVDRFRREAQAAAQLSHPNIVTAYDAESVGDRHLLVMEFVEGEDLAELVMREGRLPIPRACDYARQAALGLQHAFGRGMVHRDIKPQNLILTPQGQIKILDFGLARFLSESGPTTGGTQSGTMMGSPDYMAPEQARDAHSADIRADIYSLGCTLYVLLTGHVPFPGGSTVEKLSAHLKETPKPLAEWRPEIPGELGKVVERMMAKDPAARYQTPAEVAEALEPFCHPAPPVAEATPVAEAPQRRRRVPALAALVALGAIGVFFGATLIRFATNRGVVVIETDDPDVEVIVKQGGEQVRIIDTKTGREVTLQAGEYELELSEGKAGLKLSTNKFTLSRGGKEVVRVWIEKRTIPGWGEVIDPDGDCTISEKEGKVTIAVPGTPHDLGIASNAPRVLRDVEGDFRVQVKVSGDFNPGNNPLSLGKVSFQSAGLLLGEDEKHCVRLERNVWVTNQGLTRWYRPLFEHHRDYRTLLHMPANEQPVFRGRSSYFRLERRGNMIHAFWSHDGKDWMALDPIQVRLPRRTRIGVSATQASKTPLIVDFEEFQVTTAPAKPEPKQEAPVAFPPPVEPPPLAEYLKGREILTVAQDGSGRFKTISAAMDALKRGQVVKVLDKGPYRERLNKDLPEDVGLVSEVGTRVEIPEWLKPGPGGPNKFIYNGWWFRCPRHLRLSGFEIAGPKPNADCAFTVLLSLTADGDTTLDSCRFLHNSRYGDSLPKGGDPASSGARVDFYSWSAEPGRVCVQNNHLECALLFINSGMSILVQRNRLLGWPMDGIHLYSNPSPPPRDVVVRHNIVRGRFGVLFPGQGLESNAWTAMPVSITNNVLEGVSFPLWISDAKQDLHPKNVRIQNNIFRSEQRNGISLHAGAMSEVKDAWLVSHNCYQDVPSGIGGMLAFPRHATDLIQASPFLSLNPGDANGFRIPADSPLATGGAGGDLPKYIGALPPGPAPKEGDWFTRLRPFAADTQLEAPPASP